MSAPALSFSHMGMFVADAPRMEDFYTRLLGFTVTDRGQLGTYDLRFLSRVPSEHHQIVLVSGPMQGGGAVGLRRIHVDMLLQQGAYRLAVILFGGIR